MFLLLLSGNKGVDEQVTIIMSMKRILSFKCHATFTLKPWHFGTKFPIDIRDFSRSEEESARLLGQTEGSVENSRI